MKQDVELTLNSLSIGVPSSPQLCLHTINRCLILVLGLRKCPDLRARQQRLWQSWELWNTQEPWALCSWSSTKATTGIALFSVVADCFCPCWKAACCTSSGVNNKWERGEGMDGEGGLADLLAEAAAHLPEVSLAHFLRPVCAQVTESEPSRRNSWYYSE